MTEEVEDVDVDEPVITKKKKLLPEEIENLKTRRLVDKIQRTKTAKVEKRVEVREKQKSKKEFERAAKRAVPDTKPSKEKTEEIVGEILPEGESFSSVISKLFPKLSSSDVKKITNLPYLSANSPYFMEVLDVLHTVDSKKAINFLENVKNPEELIFDAPAVKPLRDRELLEVRAATESLETKEGLFVCPRCGSKKTTATLKQTRSSDEPMTAKIVCSNCSHKWSEG
jgi:DNA-directed RNA polymerase subunit M/transcription elongation factor TFIIS